MRRSSPEEQAAWRIESQQYSEDGPVCDNCGESICADEIPDLPILCVSCGMAREIQWEQEYERMERNEAEADIDSTDRHGWIYE